MLNYLVVGFGNPGEKYELTRHNIGFLAIDQIIDEFERKGFKYTYLKLYNSDSYEFSYIQKKIILVKPKTYMNLIGLSIYQFYKRYKVPINQVFALYDDADLLLGQLRIRNRGSAGGHNGVQSAINELKNPNFIRFRIGIQLKERAKIPLRDYVLSRFQEEEINILNEVMHKVVDAFFFSLTHSIERVMNRFNG